MKDDQAIAILAALAQQTRLSVFRMLIKVGDEGLPAGKIAEQLGVPQNTLSAHLNVLSGAGLVSSRRVGRSLIYTVCVEDTKEFIAYLVNDCCDGHPEICSLSVKTEACNAC